MRQRVFKIIFWIVVFLSATVICPAGRTHAAGRTVTDQLGRTVTVPAEPRRIIALAPSITEIVFALGKGQQLKGVTRFSDFPPLAEKLPKVGSYVRLDLERIVALKPDLCIAVKDGNPLETVQRLEALNIPVYAVDPRNFTAVMETIAEIGQLLNAGKAADRLVTDMRSRIQKVKSRVARSNRRPGVFFQIGISPIVSVGTHTFIHELIQLAGGTNLSQGPIPYPRFSREQVLRLAPEILIITSMARGEVFERVKAEWERWPDVPAVRNQRIYLVDSNLFDRATPRLVDGLEQLARLIHPEQFKDPQ